jgi:hypothetical protein
MLLHLKTTAAAPVVTAASFKNLNLRQIVAAARRYDLSPHDRLVIESARQADANHGEPPTIRDGKPLIYWATDSHGYLDAERLLDGYLCEETRVMRCDALAARQFERDAYGVYV